MNYRYKLTIAILTMNRSKKVVDALKSCLCCVLPENTQFVVVNNASTDDTELVLSRFFAHFPYDYVLHTTATNQGAGGGRNTCFVKSEGEYVYFLDDDAIIAEKDRKVFFVNSLAYMDRNPDVASLTTNIFDKVYGSREGKMARRMAIDSLQAVYTFHEGSVFLRKKAFDMPLFVASYGQEAITPCMAALNKGYVNVYYPDIHIEHLPEENKWIGQQGNYIAIQGISNIYALKVLQYPRLYRPMLLFAFLLRLIRSRIYDIALLQEFRKKRKIFWQQNSIPKIKCRTVIMCIREFGIRTF